MDLTQVTAVDQVWATDITYIPLQKGFLYLVAIMDLYSRHVVSWRLSNSLDTEFCLDALEMALASGRTPDRLLRPGLPVYLRVFVGGLQEAESKIDWSGRKRCYNDILIERLWLMLKDEESYLSV